MRRRKGLLALLAASIAAAVALMAPTAASAATGSTQPGAQASGQPATAAVLAPAGYTADGTPIYHLGHLAPGAVQSLALPHACRALGNDGITQGVICSDVAVSVGFDGLIDAAYPQAEGFCQDITVTSYYPQCANISLKYGLWQAGPREVSGDWPAQCGHSAGPCPTPRFVVKAAGWGPNAGSCAEVWTVVDKGAQIELPGSDKPVTLAANLSSGHFTFCVLG